MDFIEKQKHFEKLIKDNYELVGDEAEYLNIQYELNTSDENLETIKKLEKENRVLQIGVVGKVKAGKSSLLNALLFDGEVVLPKAATPMTAALTVITYGEKLSAEVEFFTQTDIDKLKKDHGKYLEKKETIVKKKLSSEKELSSQKQKLLDKAKSVGNKLLHSEEDLKLKAEKKAKRILKENIPLEASFQQYEKIKESKVSCVDELQDIKIIKANSFMELNRDLENFVGADGKYMPFTKSVKIKIPDTKLKDIQIVDTPGFNDPVQSRESRTRELLKFCDVILIVSPSGQFLSNEDTDLMDRITSKEGGRELYVVASQVDNELFGSIKNDSDASLPKALSIISSKLSGQMKSIISNLKNNFPEVASTYDKLIESSKDRIIFSSGISQTIINFWGDRSKWDSGTEKAWSNLKTHYPDYFSDNNKALSLSNLRKLANMNSINNIIDKIREQKNSILAKRKDDFLESKIKSFNEYKIALANYVQKQISDIENTSVEKLQQERDAMEKIKTTASDFLDVKYENLIDSLDFDLDKQLTNQIEFLKSETERDIKKANTTDVQHWTTGFWFWKKDHYREYTVVRSGAVVESVEHFVACIEDKTRIKSKEIIQTWKKISSKELISTIREKVDDKYIETDRTIKTINKVFHKIVYPKFTSIEVPLHGEGTLTHGRADKFLDEARNFVTTLHNKQRENIKSYISDLITNLKEIDLPKEFFATYDKDLADLKEQIENKEITIDLFKRFLSKLKREG